MQLCGNFLLFKSFCHHYCFPNWGNAEFFRDHPYSGVVCLSSWYLLLKKTFQGISPVTYFETCMLSSRTFTFLHEHISDFPQHLCTNGASTSDKTPNRMERPEDLLKVMQRVPTECGQATGVFDPQPSIPPAKPQAPLSALCGATVECLRKGTSQAPLSRFCHLTTSHRKSFVKELL